MSNHQRAYRMTGDPADFTGPHQFLRGRRISTFRWLRRAADRSPRTDSCSELKISTISSCMCFSCARGGSCVPAIGNEPMEGDRRLGGPLAIPSFYRMLIRAAGFLTGRRAACHWAWRELLPVFGAIVDEGRIVRDGNILSGGGVTAGIDFVLALIAELRGQHVAEMVQLGLEYAPQPPFNSGRPDTAPAEILEAVNARTAQARAQRRARLETWVASRNV